MALHRRPQATSSLRTFPEISDGAKRAMATANDPAVRTAVEEERPRILPALPVSLSRYCETYFVAVNPKPNPAIEVIAIAVLRIKAYWPYKPLPTSLATITAQSRDPPCATLLPRAVHATPRASRSPTGREITANRLEARTEFRVIAEFAMAIALLSPTLPFRAYFDVVVFVIFGMVVIVVVFAAVGLYFVEYDAHNIGAKPFERIDRRRECLAIRPACERHHQNPIHGGCHLQRFGEAQQRGRVENDEIVVGARLVQHRVELRSYNI